MRAVLILIVLLFDVAPGCSGRNEEPPPAPEAPRRTEDNNGMGIRPDPSSP
jgi:hypothetical protein